MAFQQNAFQHNALQVGLGPAAAPAEPFKGTVAAIQSAPDQLQRLAVQVVVVVNLLASTLSAVQLREPTTQQAKTKQAQYQDTSRGSPLALLSSVAAQAPFKPNLSPRVDGPRWQPADTSQGTPNTLRQPAAAPFVPVLDARIIRAAWQPLDTSQGTPKGYYTDTTFAPTNLTESIPALHRHAIGADTSRGAPLALTSAAQAAPFVPDYVCLAPIATRWQPLDTSQGTSIALTGVQAPFVPWLSLPAPQAKWQGADTSVSTPDALTAKPFFAVDQPRAPEAARQQADTTQALNLPVATFVQNPFLPVQHSAPVRNASQPLDTSIGSPQSLLALLSIKPFAQLDWPAPIEYRNTWQHQQAFFGQNPDGIPPALPVPAAAPEATGGWPIYWPRHKKLRADIERERQALEVLEQEERARERAIARAKSEQTKAKEQARLRRVEADQREHEAKLAALTKALAELMRAEQEEADEQEVIELFLRMM